jgi:hypothetical protein
LANLRKALQTLWTHPGFFLMRSIARFDYVRTATVRAQCAMRGSIDGYLRELGGSRSEYFPDADPRSMAAAVERDGLAFGLKLPSAAVTELLEFARVNPCWIDRDRKLGFPPDRIEEARQRLGRRFLLAQYMNVRQRSPLVARLTKDPVLLEIAARYLGAQPRLVGVNLWWSYPEEADAAARHFAAQMFHFDLDDFKFIKFFFYLTDVDATSGPHVVVRGTHRDKRRASFREQFAVRRYSDDEVIAAYGADAVVSITGPAGTGFAEDTMCIHKGLPPASRSRLALQIQYALNDFGNQNDDVSESALEMLV